MVSEAVNSGTAELEAEAFSGDLFVGVLGGIACSVRLLVIEVVCLDSFAEES